MTHFLMKTPPKVSTEMALHVLAYNLTRVINMIGVKPETSVCETARDVEGPLYTGKRTQSVKWSRLVTVRQSSFSARRGWLRTRLSGNRRQLVSHRGALIKMRLFRQALWC